MALSTQFGYDQHEQWFGRSGAGNHAAPNGQCLLPGSSNLLEESELPKVTHIW